MDKKRTRNDQWREESSKSEEYEHNGALRSAKILYQVEAVSENLWDYN